MGRGIQFAQQHAITGHGRHSQQYIHSSGTLQSEHAVPRGQTGHTANEENLITFSILTQNLRGAAIGSSLLDNKIRLLTHKKSDYWNENAIILLQEIKGDRAARQLVDTSVFGGKLYQSPDHSLGIVLGSKWAMKKTIPPAPFSRAQRPYFEEHRLAHPIFGKWAIFNVHLPSPTYSFPKSMKKINQDILPRIRRVLQHVDGVIVAGDFNEVLTPVDTSSTFHNPSLLPHLLDLGLADCSDDFHTHFKPGSQDSAKLDRTLLCGPRCIQKVHSRAEWLVDSDHKAVITQLWVKNTGRPSLPPKDNPRFPSRWRNTGPWDREGGIICLDGSCEGSRPTSCPLHHNCKQELDTKALGLSLDQALSRIQHAQVKILSGAATAFAEIDWSAVPSWDRALHVITGALSSSVVRRSLGTRPPRPHEEHRQLEDIVHFIIKCKSHGHTVVYPPPALQKEHLIPGPGSMLYKSARKVLRKVVRKQRREKIKVALASRLHQMATDPGTWHRRMKHPSPPLRTHACWEGDTLVFTPSKVRRHFAKQVQLTGSQVPPPSNHPYADFIPPLPRDVRSTLALPFTSEEVGHALLRARSGGAPGPSSLSFRILKLIPAEVLTKWCNQALLTGKAGKRTSRAYVRLLNKTDKEFPPPGKFRPITLLESGYKLISALIQRRLSTALRRSNSLPTNAFAFGPKTDITAPILIRTALVDHARCTGAPLVIIDFDASAAFNSPAHDTILQAWARLGVPTQVMALLQSMLSDVTFRVITDVGLSKPTPVQRGAVQGDVLAPMHWLVVYAALQHMWASSLQEVTVQTSAHHVKIRIAVYADDTAVYLSNPEDLERVANLIARSLQHIGVQVNPSKTTIQIVNPPISMPTDVDIMGQRVKVSSGMLVRYLGVFVNPNEVSPTVRQAREEIYRFGHSHRLGALRVPEAIKLVSTVLFPRLKYRLALTPASVEDIRSIQDSAFAIVRKAKGFPVGVSNIALAEVIPDLVKATISTRAEVLRTQLQKWANAEVRLPLLEGLQASLPPVLRTKRALKLALRHPLISLPLATPETMLRAVLEALVHLNVFISHVPHPALALSDLLSKPLPDEAKEEAASFLVNPARLRAEWWSNDGLRLNTLQAKQYPITASCLSSNRRYSRHLVLKKPFAVDAKPGDFLIQVYPEPEWSAYYYKVLELRDEHYVVHYLHPTGTGDLEVVEGPLPESADSWPSYVEGPRGPRGLIELDSARPVAMQHTERGWRPILSDADLGLAYAPNRIHAIIDAPNPKTLFSPLEGPNVIFTDGSGQHEAIGWGVSARINGQHIQMHGGWVDPAHTAQEGELVAMLHALALAQQTPSAVAIFSDSQHIVNSLNRGSHGKFAPLLMRTALSLSKSPHISVQHVRAHQRTLEQGPGNPEADALAKTGAQEAFAPLTSKQMPRTIQESPALVFHDTASHGLVTHTLSRRPRAKVLPAWVEVPKKTPLVLILCLLSALRGHIPGLNQDACIYCRAQDVTTSHYPSCTKLSLRVKEALRAAWRKILHKTKIPPGFWRLSPQPPWPTTTILPDGWREYNDTSNATWLVRGDRRQHEFIPPPMGALMVSPAVMAVVMSMWPDREPHASFQALRYPTILPSPALKASLPGIIDLPRLFTPGLRNTARPRIGAQVHPSWHWAFRLLVKSGNKITMLPISEEMVFCIWCTVNETLSFLTQDAVHLPPWEDAEKEGDAETVVFGNLGAHSTLYPVALEDVLHMRQLLSRIHLSDP